ncbi:MAG: hypothetical protein R6V04_16530 [bacterium]
MVDINQQHQRKPNRLKGYDYSSPGYYFVTFPNHIHGIIVIEESDSVGTEHCSVPTIFKKEK